MLVVYEFPPIGGGTGLACSQLLTQLADRVDVLIDVVTSGVGAEARVERLATNIEVCHLPVAKQHLHYWRAGELASWTRRALSYASALSRQRSYDVCHCWAGWPSGLIGYRLRQRMPYIVSLRGSDVPGYNKRLYWLDPLLLRHVVRRIWRGATRVVAVSQTLRALALKTQPAALIDVIPNGVDIHHFTPGPNDGRAKVLFVGRLIERKGVQFLLQAFCQVLAAMPDVALTIVGDGPERGRLEKLAAELGVARCVTFAGHLDRDATPVVYRDHAILVLPAVADAMPNVVLEAMAAGLAVVTTATGGREVVRGNGIIVAPGDPSALRTALLDYLTDPELLAHHRRVSRTLAEGMSWAKVAEFNLHLYREAATRSQKVTVPPREFMLGAS